MGEGPSQIHATGPSLVTARKKRWPPWMAVPSKSISPRARLLSIASSISHSPANVICSANSATCMGTKSAYSSGVIGRKCTPEGGREREGEREGGREGEGEGTSVHDS